MPPGVDRDAALADAPAAPAAGSRVLKRPAANAAGSCVLKRPAARGRRPRWNSWTGPCWGSPPPAPSTPETEAPAGGDAAATDAAPADALDAVSQPGSAPVAGLVAEPGNVQRAVDATELGSALRTAGSLCNAALGALGDARQAADKMLGRSLALSSP